MWASIIKVISGLVSLANNVIPSWEYKAGRAAVQAEQAVVKTRLDNIYDKIDDKYISPDNAGSLLLHRSRNYYGQSPETKAST